MADGLSKYHPPLLKTLQVMGSRGLSAVAPKARYARRRVQGRTLAFLHPIALGGRCYIIPRGSGPDPTGQRATQSRGPATHGPEHHAKGWLEGVSARQAPTGRLERCLSLQTPRILPKCDCPGPKRLPCQVRSPKPANGKWPACRAPSRRPPAPFMAQQLPCSVCTAAP